MHQGCTRAQMKRARLNDQCVRLCSIWWEENKLQRNKHLVFLVSVSITAVAIMWLLTALAVPAESRWLQHHPATFFLFILRDRSDIKRHFLIPTSCQGRRGRSGPALYVNTSAFIYYKQMKRQQLTTIYNSQAYFYILAPAFCTLSLWKKCFLFGPSSVIWTFQLSGHQW